MDFGTRLQQHMQIRELSQYALAKKLGCSQSIVSSYVGGGKKPSYNMLAKICAALNISLSDFFAEDAPTPPSTEAELLTAFRALPEDKQQQAVRLVKAL